MNEELLERAQCLAYNLFMMIHYWSLTPKLCVMTFLLP